MDHVSSIFTLDPIASIEHNLQATFHHIFKLDPLHTFKLNHTSLTDSSNIAEQIRHFIPHTSANPKLHTRFFFTEPAYIRAFTNTNPRIHLHILQNYFHIPYALSLNSTHVYTCFLFCKQAYRSSKVIGQHTYSDQIHSSDFTLHFRNMFASSQI